jgi:hypothetical protein
MRISGDPATGEVRIDGRRLSPVPSQQVWNHSPDGFNWGYAGSGPAQLALAILLAAGLDEERAVRLHQWFKADYIQHLPQAEFFTLDVDVVEWANGVREYRGEVQNFIDD